MKDTWGAGVLELLRHAKSHMGSSAALDSRLAYVSIDNAVELTLRAFVETQRIEGEVSTRRDPSATFTSFPAILKAAFNELGGSVRGLEFEDIQPFHEVRNQIYHAGLGLGVDSEYVQTYFDLAVLLMKEMLSIEESSIGSTPVNLRPDVKLEIKAEILAREREAHSKRAKQAMGQLREGHNKIGRAARSLSEEEIQLVSQLDAEGFGSKRIAAEINRIRRYRAGQRNAKRTVHDVSDRTIRRRLSKARDGKS